MTCKECLFDEMCFVTHTDSSPACLDFYGWIPADERFPKAEYDEYIKNNPNGLGVDLIVMIRGAKTPAALIFDGECFVDEYGFPYAVTHWMPFPPAPMA